MSVNQRIKKLYENLNLKQSQFAETIGQSSGTISNIVRSVNNPSFAVIQAILSKYRNLNHLWLLLGEGQMWLDKEDEPSTEDELLDKLIPLLENRVRQLEEEIKKDDPEKAKRLGIE